MNVLSAAACIIQVIDIASRLVAKGAQLHRSTNGQLVEHQELATISLSLSDNAEKIRRSLAVQRRERNLTKVELEQEQIGKNCQHVAAELLDVLRRLMVRGRRCRWRSFRQALLTIWHEDKIQSLERRLDRFRQQMIAN